MDGTLPAIDVRSVAITDALALHELDYSFETDRIYACLLYTSPSPRD